MPKRQTYSFRRKGRGHTEPHAAGDYVDAVVASEQGPNTIQDVIRESLLFCAKKRAPFDPEAPSGTSSQDSESGRVERTAMDRSSEHDGGLTAAEMAQQQTESGAREDGPARGEEEANSDGDEETRFWDRWT